MSRLKSRAQIAKETQGVVLKDLTDRLGELQNLLNCRAGKLLRKRKDFIVVAYDEPYFPEAYRLIRIYERAKGTWTTDCEYSFRRLMDMWLTRPMK